MLGYVARVSNRQNLVGICLVKKEGVDLGGIGRNMSGNVLICRETERYGCTSLFANERTINSV